MDSMFHMINKTYKALPMRARTRMTTFSCKDVCTLMKHTRRWTYSALRYFSKLILILCGHVLLTTEISANKDLEILRKFTFIGFNCAKYLSFKKIFSQYLRFPLKTRVNDLPLSKYFYSQKFPETLSLPFFMSA